MRGYSQDYGPVFKDCAIEEIEYTPGRTGVMSVIAQGSSSDYEKQIDSNRIEASNQKTLKRIVYDEGITEIAACAAYGRRTDGTGPAFKLTLDEIVLPSTLKKVGEYAFYYMGTTVFTSPVAVYPEEIGESAFYNCDGLTKQVIPLPGRINKYGDYAFYDCDNLTDELVLDGSEPFADKCLGSIDSLKKMTLPVDMPYTRTQENRIINPFEGCVNIETLIYTPGYTGIMNPMGTSVNNCPEGWQYCRNRIESIARNSLKTLIYEEGVKELASYAGQCYFDSAEPIAWETVSLPDSIEKIGFRSFRDENPTEFHLGPNIKEIGDYAFMNVTSPFTGRMEQLEKIGERAFFGSSITFDTLVLPGKVKSIGATAFGNCTGLIGTLEIPNDQSLGSGAFRGCTGIKKVIIPVDKIYTHVAAANGEEYGPVFKDCAIEEIEYTPGKTGVMNVIAQRSSSDSEKQIDSNRIEASNKNTLKRIVYDEGITEIAACAAYGRRTDGTGPIYILTLDEIVLPSTLVKVGDYAFYSTKITSAYLLRNVTEIGTKAFDNNPNLTMYVYRNTYAHQYAINNNKPYVLLDPSAESISFESKQIGMVTGHTKQLSVIYEPADATDPLFWTSSDSTIVSVDDNGLVTAHKPGTAIIKAVSSENESIYAECEVTVADAWNTLTSAALELQGYIIMNYKLDIPEEYKDAEVVMTVDNTETRVKVSDVEPDADNIRVFNCKAVSTQMRDEIVLKVMLNNEELPLKTQSGTVCTGGHRYTVEQAINAYKSLGIARITALVDALDNFGKYAQIFFGHNAEGLTPDGVSDVTADKLETYEGHIGANIEGLTIKSASVELASATSIWLKYELGAGKNISNYTFEIDGKPAAVEYDGTYYVLKVENIASNKLGYKYTVTATDGTNTQTVEYSALSYAYSVLSGGTTGAYADLCKAMYKYYNAAVTVFGE